MVKEKNKDNFSEILSTLAKRENTEISSIIEIVKTAFHEVSNNDRIQLEFDKEENRFFFIEKENNEKKYNLEDLDLDINHNLFKKKIEEIINFKKTEKTLENFKNKESHLVSGKIVNYSISLIDNNRNFNNNRSRIIRNRNTNFSLKKYTVIVNLGEQSFGYWNVFKYRSNKNNQDDFADFLDYYINDKKAKEEVIWFIIKEIDKDGKIFLSRRESDDFIKQIVSLNVPEVKKGYIKIIKIIRYQWGSNEKIKLLIDNSENYNTDPTGACIGSERSRINCIEKDIRENLNNIRKDISIIYLDRNSSDYKENVFKLIFPFKAITILNDEEEKDTINVTVPFYQEYFWKKHNRENNFFSETAKDFLGKKIKLILDEEDANPIRIWNGNITSDKYAINSEIFKRKKNNNSGNTIQ